jgi:hypothetical protein
MTSEKSTDGRWDMHKDRQIAAAKGGALAVTILNSGSWLALLSQVSNLEGYDTGWPVLAWGTGALLGTLIWLFIYRGTALQWDHDFDRDNEKIIAALDMNIRLGFGTAIASLACFGIGVLMLAVALI